jgi:hypothetical protein
MEIFKQDLITQADTTGFDPKILEKVWRLLAILERINSDSYLKDRLALKGGTALNLFFFDVPRLSVDIDFNYIGEVVTEKMLADRPLMEVVLEESFRKERLTIQRIPNKYAGGKWRLKYLSVFGGSENLEVDLNYMFRLPIWELRQKSSYLVGDRQVHNIKLFNEYELAAGKLVAFFARRASRDLFDAHHLLTKFPFDQEKLRFTFLLYGAMSSLDLRKMSIADLNFEVKELKMKLMPVLKRSVFQESSGWINWPQAMLAECKTRLSFLFSFRPSEKKFLDILYEEGKIDASLLTTDQNLIENIHRQPLLKWKSLLAMRNQPVRPI